MQRLPRRSAFAPVVATALLLAGCAGGPGYGPPHHDRLADRGWHGDDHGRDHWRDYDYAHPDPAYGGYEADRYYREDADAAHERQVARDERVYRGRDGRYYCRRSDGSTGLIVGAVAGGVLGNAIAPGGSELFGTLLGATAGGVAGHAIDENSVHCR